MDCGRIVVLVVEGRLCDGVVDDVRVEVGQRASGAADIAARRTNHPMELEGDPHAAYWTAVARIIPVLALALALEGRVLASEGARLNSVDRHLPNSSGPHHHDRERATLSLR